MKKTLFDFYDDIDGLIHTAEELRTQLRYQDDKIKRLENRQRTQVDFHRFKIIRAIMQNICQGLDEETAIERISAAEKRIKFIRPSVYGQNYEKIRLYSLRNSNKHEFIENIDL